MTRTDDTAVPDYQVHAAAWTARTSSCSAPGRASAARPSHALAAVGARVFCVDLDAGLADDIAKEVGGVPWAGDAIEQASAERLYQVPPRCAYSASIATPNFAESCLLAISPAANPVRDRLPSVPSEGLTANRDDRTPAVTPTRVCAAGRIRDQDTHNEQGDERAGHKHSRVGTPRSPRHPASRSPCAREQGIRPRTEQSVQSGASVTNRTDAHPRRPPCSLFSCSLLSC